MSRISMCYSYVLQLCVTVTVANTSYVRIAGICYSNKRFSASVGDRIVRAVQ